MAQLSWTKTNRSEWRGGDFRILKMGTLFALYRGNATLGDHPSLEAAMDKAERVAAVA